MNSPQKTVIISAVLLIYCVKFETLSGRGPIKYQHSLSRLKLVEKFGTNGKLNKTMEEKLTPVATFSRDMDKVDQVVIALVACEFRLYETINLMKSILIFTNTSVLFLIFTDEYHKEIENTLSRWKTLNAWNDFEYEILVMGAIEIEEKFLIERFRKCGAQKLLLPQLLPDIDSVIYVETDTLFLGPVEELWVLFKQFSTQHVAAMSQDPDLDSVPILMNLTRMRSFGWLGYLNQALPKWKAHIDLSGQDMLDIIFNRHFNLVMKIPCRYNYQTNMCDTDKCPEAYHKGVLLLHNGSPLFSNVSEPPAYMAIYNAIDGFEIGSHPMSVLGNLQRNLEDSPTSPCDLMLESFMAVPLETFYVWSDLTRVVISVIGCGPDYRYALNLVKSALIFTKSPIYFVIYTEQHLKTQIVDVLAYWKSLNHSIMDFEVHAVTLQDEEKRNGRSIIKKCSNQKLFYPTRLPHIDALISVDPTSVFLGSVDDMWDMFKEFSPRTVCAMAADHYVHDLSYYPMFSKTPYFGKMGLNSGVILMNLTRMREFGWTSRVINTHTRWKHKIQTLPQDIMNIIFHFYPDGVMQILCRYNFRSIFCDDPRMNRSSAESICPDAAIYGVNLLHASRENFEDELHPFSAIYRTLEQYRFSEDASILTIIMKWYMSSKDSQNYCKSLFNQYLEFTNTTLSKMYQHVTHKDAPVIQDGSNKTSIAKVGKNI